MANTPDDAVSDDLVEAVLNAEEGIENAPEWFRSDKRADIRATLTAAAPIIEADVRRRVAEEIRAAAWPTDKADTEGLDFGYALGRNAGLDIAAQIAERSGE